MIMPLKRYADFTGRSQRQEYWMFALFVFLVFMAGLIVMFVAAAAIDTGAYGANRRRRRPR